MTVTEIQAKTILRKSKKIDSWFMVRYGMNLYRGCMHNCSYCDGRYEKYRVEGDFGRDVEVKTNAIEILDRELNPERKRKPMKPGFIMMSGGVGDSYQPIEKKYGLSRKALEVIYTYNFAVHVLTKSILVEKDIDILKKINNRRKAIVSFSFSSTDDKITRIFEPGASTASQKLASIKRLKAEGISCGMFLMPVLPFISDSVEVIDKSVRDAKEAGVDFIIFGGMTLKGGRQEQYFYSVVEKHYPGLLDEYHRIFPPGYWSSAIRSYYPPVNAAFYKASRKYKMPVRVPLRIFSDQIDETDLVVVMLEHISAMLRSRGEESTLGKAAYEISQIKETLSSMKGRLQEIEWVGEMTEKIILEILDTGTCDYYEKMMSGYK